MLGVATVPMANRADGKRFVSTRVEVEGREEVRTVELPFFEPEPWKADTPLSIVGRCALRADAAEKVTGRARYSADIQRDSPFGDTLRKSILSPALRSRAAPRAFSILVRSSGTTIGSG